MNIYLFVGSIQFKFFIQLCFETYVIYICKSLNAFGNPRECDILSEF